MQEGNKVLYRIIEILEIMAEDTDKGSNLEYGLLEIADCVDELIDIRGS